MKIRLFFRTLVKRVYTGLFDGLVNAECANEIYFDHGVGWIVASARNSFPFFSLQRICVSYFHAFSTFRFFTVIYADVRGEKTGRDWILIMIQIGQRKCKKTTDKTVNLIVTLLRFKPVYQYWKKGKATIDMFNEIVFQWTNKQERFNFYRTGFKKKKKKEREKTARTNVF